MNNAKFTADVKRFSELAKEKMLAVARQSIQDVISDAQTPVAQGGLMPVDTGFLRNSLTSGLNGGGASKDAIVLTVAAMDIGDTVNFAWTADYAIPRHYMISSKGGGMWRDVAAAKWQATIAKNVAKVRA